MIFLCGMMMQIHAQQSPDSKNNFLLNIHFIDKDSSFKPQPLKLQTKFNNLELASAYVGKLPSLLASKGYPVASVDSIWTTSTALHINLYLGIKYNWVQLKTYNIDKKALSESGFLEKKFFK